MVASSLPFEKPRGSKKPTGGVIPTWSLIQAFSWVDWVVVFVGAKAALFVERKR